MSIQIQAKESLIPYVSNNRLVVTNSCISLLSILLSNDACHLFNIYFIDRQFKIGKEKS